MRVLISGASGLIGSAVTRALAAAGDTPVALVRRAPREAEVQWNPVQPVDPDKLANCDAVVHLAGKNIAGYWTQRFKQEVRDSRVQGTRTLATAAAESFRSDELLTEDSPPGQGYLADVSQEWEAATNRAREAGLRVVNLRIGVVLARGGGALPTMLLPYSVGLGGRTGSGKQYWSWVSLDDVAGIILFALHNDKLQGPVNVVSPEPVRNAEFVRALGAQLHRPTLFPLPGFIVHALLGEMGDAALLGSARVE